MHHRFAVLNLYRPVNLHGYKLHWYLHQIVQKGEWMATGRVNVWINECLSVLVSVYEEHLFFLAAVGEKMNM